MITEYQKQFARLYNGELLYMDISDNPNIPMQVEFAKDDQTIVAKFATSYDVNDVFMAIYRCTIVGTGENHAILC